MWVVKQTQWVRFQILIWFRSSAAAGSILWGCGQLKQVTAGCSNLNGEMDSETDGTRAVN